MPKYVVPIDSYDSFRTEVLHRAEVLGKGYDVDNAYGDQCWDGACLLWTQIGSWLQTGGQDAKGCWLVPWAREANTVPGKFTQVTRLQDVKRGDVFVFNGAGTGHIAYADEDYNPSGYMNFLGQNQGPGSGPKGTPFNVTRLGTSKFLGAFRFIAWQSIEPPHPPIPPSPHNYKRSGYPWAVALNLWRR